MFALDRDVPAPSTPAPFTVEKGIPVPPAVSNAKYPWGTMEIGDSFLVTDRAKFESARLAAYQQRARGRHLVARSTPQGLRIWRTA